MPIYEYSCNKCENAYNEIYVFEKLVSISNRDSEQTCEKCGELANRKLSTFAMQEGLSCASKKMGVTKERADKTRYMKDAREKRKKNYAPDTKEGSSNELWTGNEVRDGVIPPPRKDVTTKSKKKLPV